MTDSSKKIIILYSISDIAEVHGVSREHVRNLKEEGKLPPSRYQHKNQSFWDALPEVIEKKKAGKKKVRQR